MTEGHVSLPRISIHLTSYKCKTYFMLNNVFLPKTLKIEQREPFRLFFFLFKMRPARQLLLHVFRGQAQNCQLGCFRHPQLKL